MISPIYSNSVPPLLLIQELTATAFVPVTAAALIDSLHNDANIATFRMDDHSASQIEPHVRFILGVRGAVAEQEITRNQLVSRDHVAQRPKSIAILTIVPNAGLTHEP